MKHAPFSLAKALFSKKAVHCDHFHYQKKKLLTPEP